MSLPTDSAMHQPLVLVGLPRSGSTLMSRLLNESPDGFMVNDFYFLQKVESLDGFSAMTPEHRRTLLAFIVEQIRNRTRPEGVDDEVWFGLPLDPEQLDRMDTYVAEYEAAPDERWSQTLENVIAFAATMAGRNRWGWNTPQDYLLADEIIESYPGARFLFLLRSPSKTLLSYKYYWTVVPKFAGDRGRYHPVVQSLAWRSCARAYLDMRDRLGSDRCELVTFEDLIADTSTTMKTVEEFTGWDFPVVNVEEFGHNSSLASKVGGDRVLTGLEIAICRRITASTQRRLGFEPTPATPLRAGDVVDFSATTIRSAIYHARSLGSSTNSRRRASRFIRAQLKR